MEKCTVSKGLILKDIIQYDDHSVEFHHQKLQSPISLSPFGWRGFIAQEDSEVIFDKDLHFFVNTGKILGKKTLYLLHSDKYETLPTTEQELSSDDKDDFTYMQLGDNTNEDIEPDEEPEALEVGESSIKDTDVDYDADLYLKPDIIQLRLKNVHIERILSFLKDSPSIEMNTAKVGPKFFSLNQQLLAYDDDWALHVRNRSKIDSTPIHHMTFFLEKKPFLPFIGENGLYCGYHRQINITGISKSVINEFREWCRKRAPRLTSKGDNYQSSVKANPFNLFRWIHPDQLSITDEALVYTRKTLRRNEMIYLPFKRISVFLSSKGLLTKEFEVYGEQNIIPKYSFSSSNVSAIKKAMEEHHVNTAVGRSWHASFLFFKNWFGRAPRILKVDERLIFYPKRLKSEMKNFYGMTTRVSALNKMEIEKVIWYKTIFNPFGTIVIKGTPANIRNDQREKTAIMIVPNLSMVCYGSLRDFLKESNAEFKRKHKKYKFK